MSRVLASLLFVATTLSAQPVEDHVNKAVTLIIPSTAAGASISHQPSFASFSFEPAFWLEFFGNVTSPNSLTFSLLDQIVKHGGRPIIRPGGDTMDSMIFNSAGGDPVRTISATGGVYRTTVGPAYFQTWSNFPTGTKFISTLDFENNTLSTALGMAVASVKYQAPKVLYFELGNEPTNYPRSRWNDSTAAYVAQWKSWTATIDAAVNSTLGASAAAVLGSRRWLGSSATTDNSGLHVRPADLIPAGIDSAAQVAEYSIHSYPFSTCDPARAAIAQISNILNHTALTTYADTEILPSAQAALAAGNRWVIGEFNSISCSGKPNVSDTFAQALWTIDSELIYATRNASAVHLHQGATLVLQSSNQTNTAGANGSPGYSTYNMLYPRTSEKRGLARVLPSFVSQLFMAEAFAVPETRVAALATPAGVSSDNFAAYAFYVNNTLSKLALVNLTPYYANSAVEYAVRVDISAVAGFAKGGIAKAWAKRLSAPYVEEGNAEKVTWAGQAYPLGVPKGIKKVVTVGRNGVVRVRGSQAVLVFFNEAEAFRY